MRKSASVKELRAGIVVNVTKRDIERGLEGVASMCPIALALKRRVGADDAMVIFLYASIKVEGSKWVADMPAGAQRFVHEFDAGESVTPMRFKLKFKPVMWTFDT